MAGTMSEAAGALKTAAPAPGHCRISIHGSEEFFDIGRNEVLLSAALKLGIDYPHGCRVGSCGSCKTRLIGGRISPMVDFALSPLSNEQLRAGYVLACQAKVRTDLVVDVLLGHRHTHAARIVPGRVVVWRRLPGEVIDLRLQLVEPLPYDAGQYCSLAQSGSFVRRSYSFYDAPPADGKGANEVGFLVRRLPGGQFSEWLFSEDRTGVKIWLEGPFGTMGIDDVDIDGLCIAGGTGLAPILSIVEDRLRRSATAKFTIVFGVRNSREIFCKDRLDALVAGAPERVRVVVITSNEAADSSWQGARGLVTEALTPALGIDYAKTGAFICGSLAMVGAVEAKLLGLGVTPDRIHADKFLPSAY